MMQRVVVLLLYLSLFVGTVHAQYNEREIMSQQAVQMMTLRQYSEAEQLFKQLLAKYPDDVNSILQLIQLYVITSQISKADELLESSRRDLGPSLYSEQRIYVYILQGEQVKAMQLTKSYLQQMNHDQNKYRQLASYFSMRGFYEQELELYSDARKYLKNGELFGLEIANTAMNYHLYTQSLTEYLKYLDKNPQNSFYVSNQCRLILKDDSTMVNVIASFAQNSPNIVIKELYANALTALSRYNEAIEIFKTLPADKLQRFAEEQYAALNDDVAYRAFEQLTVMVSDVIQQNIYFYRMAQLQFRNNKITFAKSLLQRIIDNPQLQDRNLRNRSTLNMDARKLMADIALSTDNGESALQWLKQAKTFARVSKESSEMDMEITRLLLMQEQYPEAVQILNTIVEPSLSPTRDYYLFLNALMQNHIETADSLMNSYVICYPASKYVNDAIYLMMLMYDLNDEQKSLFLQAYRKQQLHQEASVDLLIQLFVSKPDEELRIMAVEWAIALSKPVRALELLNFQWTDELIGAYAETLKVKLIKNVDYEQRLAREFLQQNPNSIFSPSFRQLLNRQTSAKPNL